MRHIKGNVGRLLLLLGIALPVIALPLTSLTVNWYLLPEQHKSFIDRIGHLVIQLREGKGSEEARCGILESKVTRPHVSPAVLDDYFLQELEKWKRKGARPACVEAWKADPRPENAWEIPYTWLLFL